MFSLADKGWGTSVFRGLTETLFTFPTGSTLEYTSIGEIFDAIWLNISNAILQNTLVREETDWKIEDINLFLASMLVMGLTPEPSIEDYFKQDEIGIFGSKWMQQQFTKHKWCFMHAHIHYDYQQCIDILKTNSQQAWNLQQVLVIDEMIEPFTGR